MLGLEVSGLREDVGSGPALHKNIVVQLVLHTGCAEKVVQYAERLQRITKNRDHLVQQIIGALETNSLQKNNTKTTFSETLLGPEPV